MTDITENLAALRARLDRAARVADRDPQSVTVVAVGKSQPAARIAAAACAGLTDFGENYVQEALPKIAGLGPGPVWHFIGRIQANKTRAIAEHFHWVQTIATPRVAERLSAQRPRLADDLQVCLQVRPAEAGGRAGAPQEQVAALAEVVAGLPRLRLRGLMFMPVPGPDGIAPAGAYRQMQQLFATLRARFGLDTLSMGMSADLEAAIAAGSTMVRIGTALFGQRRTD